MKLLYEKLDLLFKVNTNQAALMVYIIFLKDSRPQNVTIAGFNIEFDQMLQQSREHETKLLEKTMKNL